MVDLQGGNLLKRDVEITKAQRKIPVLNLVQNPLVMRALRNIVNHQVHGRLIEAIVDEDVVVWLAEEGIIILEAGGSMLLLAVGFSNPGLARRCPLLQRHNVLQFPN